MLQIPGLYIKKLVNKGRAVFTSLDIPSGSTIEVCPVLVIPEQEVATIHNTVLHDYYFRWQKNQKGAAILLGLGSIYNHSERPNARAILSFEEQEVIFEAICEIPSGSEITFDYFDDDTREEKIWFEIH